MTKLDSAGVFKPAGTPAEIEDALTERGDRLTNSNDDREDDLDNERRARAHFPHLARDVAPRESDEYPTFWEGQ